MSGKTSTRQLILEAAIGCIEKFGLEAVTTRRIAVEAGTNLASINYHFRSKDHLLREALSMTIKHMLQDVVGAIEGDQPFDQMLQDVLFYLLDGCLRFPGVSRAHLREAISGPGSISARAMSRVFDGLSRRAASAFPRKDPGRLRLRMSQLMSSILFTMLVPDFFTLARPYRLRSSRDARGLARSYTDLFLSSI